MFRRLPEADTGTDTGAVTVTLDGVPVRVRADDTVAAALLVAASVACRTTPVSGAPRAPYCMMGVCFDCLLEIDGIGNRQSCMTPLRAGMVIRSQHGRRALGQ